MDDLASADLRKRVDALLSLALYDSDWRWVQDQCLRLLADSEEDIVATAILGLGHLARLHQRLDLERVLPPLITLQADQRFSGRVSDAFADIRMFVSDSKGRINRGEEEPQNTAALIQILRDRSARIDERDDADGQPTVGRIVLRILLLHPRGNAILVNRDHVLYLERRGQTRTPLR